VVILDTQKSGGLSTFGLTPSLASQLQLYFYSSSLVITPPGCGGLRIASFMVGDVTFDFFVNPSGADRPLAEHAVAAFCAKTAGPKTVPTLKVVTEEHDVTLKNRKDDAVVKGKIYLTSLKLTDEVSSSTVWRSKTPQVREVGVRV
jgi:hypothetical protein